MRKIILFIFFVCIATFCYAQMSQRAGTTGTFVGASGVSISTSATSTAVLRFRGFTQTLSTHTMTYGDVWGQKSDNTLWMSTRTVAITDGDATCAGTVCYVKLSN